MNEGINSLEFEYTQKCICSISSGWPCIKGVFAFFFCFLNSGKWLYGLRNCYSALEESPWRRFEAITRCWGCQAWFVEGIYELIRGLVSKISKSESPWLCDKGFCWDMSLKNKKLQSGEKVCRTSLMELDECLFVCGCVIVSSCSKIAILSS